MTKRKMTGLLNIEDKYSLLKYQHKTLALEKNAAIDKAKCTTEEVKAVKGAVDEVKVSNEEKYYAMKERLELSFERKVEGLRNEKDEADNELAR